MRFTVGRFEIDIKVCDTLYHERATKGDALRFMSDINALYLLAAEQFRRESEQFKESGDLVLSKARERMEKRHSAIWRQIFDQLDAAGYYDTENGW